MSVESVVVLGTGTMAPGIAAACVVAGASVTIAGRDAARAAAAAAAAGPTVAHAAIAPEAFEGCDLVLETVREDIGVKRSLLASVEGCLGDAACIATNTSSLPVAGIASALAHPERFAAMHFLHPADLTAVVEVVPGPKTDPATVETLVELARRMKKQPLVLRRDHPGFIWNRIQMAVIRECMQLLDEGVADLEAVDAAVSDGLAPRWIAAGPLATSDLGGSETFRIIAEQLFPQLAASAAVSERLGEGFYSWTDDSRTTIRTLRSEAIAAGRAFAARRRAGAPGARGSLDSRS